ncbi:MAG: TetR/AcrR family transcriptional regulator [Bacteroidetes bacterium]|nr:TetR/AcrR family transcriptional regulator [Bacteroidota bacterium]
MSPRTQEQFEEMRESRRQQIMNAALELFVRKGYANCSIAQLASYAGISKGLMYNYFESKEALLLTIIENGISDSLDYFDPNHDGVLTTEELEGFIRKVFSSIRENQQFWILYINIVLQPGVKEFLEGKPFSNVMDEYGPMLMEYFTGMGFEDPALEMLTFSALIEGFGILIVYAYPSAELPDELLRSFEERVIGMFTKKTQLNSSKY